MARLTVRPEAIRLVGPGTPGSLRGQLEETIYGGSTLACLVRLSPSVRVTARIPSADRPDSPCRRHGRPRLGHRLMPGIHPMNAMTRLGRHSRRYLFGVSAHRYSRATTLLLLAPLVALMLVAFLFPIVRFLSAQRLRPDAQPWPTSASSSTGRFSPRFSCARSARRWS